MSADDGPAAPDPRRRRGRLRTVAAVVTTTLAFLLVWYALVAPNKISRVTPGAFVHIPLEGLAVVALVLVLPARARRVVALVVGVLLGLLTILKIVDMGFYAALDRPFNPVTDASYFGPAFGVLSDSIGHAGAVITLIAVAALVVGILALMALSVAHLTRLAAGHRAASVRAGTALGLVWVLFAVLGAQIVPGDPVASRSAVALAYHQASEVRVALHEKQAFERASAVDAFRDTPGQDLLSGLRGKDVIFAFVESYGRVAVEGSDFSPRVDAVLDDGTRRLRAAGFSARTGFLRSPTFGALSWLAHSTLQSGLWVDNQLLYDELVTSDRLTLNQLFKRAGWRTVSDVPSDDHRWPEGTSFYHYDKLYDSRNVGYRGPSFSYANMPDQFTLSAFRRLELAKPHHPPVMAEIDLVSSHHPWAPLPSMVPWHKVGDGSVFAGMPARADSVETVWRSSDRVRAAYGKSIEYSMRSLVSFVQRYPDPDLVLVLLGDHQPATIVSGQDASRDVPISIVAHDPAVIDRISAWGWKDGLRPDPHAPVWRMSDFRDRFLTAYGPSAATP